jgi:DNA invertase Pin-like site-specific DNA recombinase
MYAPAVHDEIIDHGLTSTNRERPGLRQALAACRDGDTWW